jgi:hypothetical protein
MIENPMVSGLAAHQEREESRASEESARYAYLHAQMLDALLNDPNREVECPGFGGRNNRRPAHRAAWSAVEDKHTAELFAFISNRVQGYYDPTEKIRRVLDSIAHAHADLHAGAEE